MANTRLRRAAILALSVTVLFVIALAMFVAGIYAERTRHPIAESVVVAWRTSRNWVTDRFADAVPPRRSSHTRAASDDELTLEQLRRLGYIQGYQEAPEESGVVVRNDDLMAPGVTLISSGGESGARLIDSAGQTLHRWSKSIEEVFGDRAQINQRDYREYWRRAVSLPDGNILAMFEGHGVFRLDRASTLVWKLYNQAHHEIRVEPDGRIYTLTRRKRLEPRIHRVHDIVEDFVAVIDENGRRLEEFSVVEALLDSPWRDVLEQVDPEREPDILHTNALLLLDGTGGHRLPFLRPGNVLVSLLRINALAVLQLEPQPRALWVFTGPFVYQHDPSITEAGSILLFDNQGLPGRSRVLEIDPSTEQIRWSFDHADQGGFYSECCGTVQRLANGNTLVNVTAAGRVLEVTPSGDIAWEWVNPGRVGKDGDLIASVFESRRLTPDEVRWLSE